MDDSNDNPTMVLTGKIMVAAVMVVFLVVVFVFCLHLYSKCFRRYFDEADRDLFQGGSRRRHGFVFNSGQDLAVSTINGRGLDPYLLHSIPVLVYNPLEFKNGLECSVCLTELENGEKARLLPKCNHGFHVDCIDMWFQSHSTCPLCRNPVAPASSNSSDFPGANFVAQNVQMQQENLDSTNMLSWGNQTQMSSVDACSSSATSIPGNGVRPHEMLVIDIPGGMMINPSSSSPSTAARFGDDELKSPLTTRLRSLKRLLSRDNSSSHCSPTSVDLEQGMRGHDKHILLFDQD